MKTTENQKKKKNGSSNLVKSIGVRESMGELRLELGVHRLWNYVELFWNSLDNGLLSIVFY